MPDKTVANVVANALGLKGQFELDCSHECELYSERPAGSTCFDIIRVPLSQDDQPAFSRSIFCEDPNSAPEPKLPSEREVAIVREALKRAGFKMGVFKFQPTTEEDKNITTLSQEIKEADRSSVELGDLVKFTHSRNGAEQEMSGILANIDNSKKHRTLFDALTNDGYVTIYKDLTISTSEHRDGGTVKDLCEVAKTDPQTCVPIDTKTGTPKKLSHIESGKTAIVIHPYREVGRSALEALKHMIEGKGKKHLNGMTAYVAEGSRMIKLGKVGEPSFKKELDEYVFPRSPQPLLPATAMLMASKDLCKADRCDGKVIYIVPADQNQLEGTFEAIDDLKKRGLNIQVIESPIANEKTGYAAGIASDGGYQFVQDINETAFEQAIRTALER